MSQTLVNTELVGTTFIVSINRPHVRNAVDRDCASELAEAFRVFENDDRARAAVLGALRKTLCAYRPALCADSGVACA